MNGGEKGLAMTDTVQDAQDSFDACWEDLYAAGRHTNRYPFDSVVRFMFLDRPRDLPIPETRVLEVGCGAGNNLWFAAREGFDVTGIDGSESAIGFARRRFEAEGLKGDLRVGDFTALPFEDSSFHMAIDRAALSQTPGWAIRKAIAEVRRVLKPGGRFHLNCYSDRSSSAQRDAHARRDPDGLMHDVSAGSLAGVGQICTYGKNQVEDLFTEGWNINSLVHVEQTEMNRARFEIHAEWLVIAERTE